MKKQTYQPHLGLFKKSVLGASIALAASSAMAQEQSDSAKLEEVVVTGIRASLASAIDAKRESTKLVEVIIADDIGKLPDQNLAEVMENITGVQITRTAGVGTGVQIRGTNANRVEINGVSTVGSGSGRSGINFEDINPAIIAEVEVTKSPDAKTIEGSVGGTVNLKTIRPLNLSETLGFVRVQGEDSSLSTEGIKPRFAGAYGDNWETSAGDFGFVISGSYTEQEALSFRPRVDRDNLNNFEGNSPSEFLGIQFMVQEQENDDYETVNLASTFEWAPSDALKFSFDAVINNQERSRDAYKIEASGVSNLRAISYPDSFETVDFGVGDVGNNGVVDAALTGRLSPDLAYDDDDPNMRFTSETNSRITDTELFRLAGEWQGDRLKASFELARSNSDTTTPKLNTTLNFINPNCPLQGGTDPDAITANTGADNCVPYIYDLTGGSLAFGIDFENEYAPTPEQLTDPNNVVLRALDVSRNTQDNTDDQFRLDFTYDVERFGLTSVDFGYRYNNTTGEHVSIKDKIGNFSKLVDAPRGTLFEDLLVEGPDNYGDADGRDLFVKNFLLVDPDRSFSDPDGTIAALEAAFAANRELYPEGTGATSLNLQEDLDPYYNIEEETSALYAQANFEFGIVSGNVGLRYLETDIDSTGYTPSIAGSERELTTNSSNYDFLLPRLNLKAQLTDDLLIRFGYGSDIRRPSFDDIRIGYSFTQAENSAVSLGNPGVEPEEVDSFDIAAEWYFAPSGLLSIGYFHKERTNLFGSYYEGAALYPSDTTTGGLERDATRPCEDGGIWNPEVIPNTFGDPNSQGLCVDFTRPENVEGTTKQKGIELQFQYDLGDFEDSLGWASGFGILANYTVQEFSGDTGEDTTSGRGLAVLGEVTLPRGLLDFSENAYNITAYYEKYGLSARMRYTWREAFRTQDFGGGANTSGSSTFSFPVYTHDRGQLNASISYAVTEQLSLGVEAVNLTEEEITQTCVSESGPVCFSGYPDRRITFGASYRF
ncbi:TonB-dependent receptor [Gilvimarinus chinensis]|uniref:TonB-dependent receptor n=1 Tax=Gilvimarinus chinensis TaxID=396005 RepID=UPI00037EE843|nr:TonB-dependent receptor [Gilvimarinus chinensis]